MEMSSKAVKAEQIYPILGVDGSVAISRRGSLTLGWEVDLPVAFSVNEAEYDDIIACLASAIRVLPEYSVVHKQDIFTKETYHAEEADTYLCKAYEEHFDGRPYFVHRCLLFVSLASKGMVERAGSGSALFGLNGAANVPPASLINSFRSKCEEFISIVTRTPLLRARVLTQDDWLGKDDDPGIVQRYMMLGDTSSVMSDISMTPSSVTVYDQVLQAYAIGDTDMLPGDIPSVERVQELSGITNEVLLSYGARLGLLLDCNHIVNHYIIIPPQDETLHRLEKERNKMHSGITSTDNRINGAEVSVFLDRAYAEGLFLVKSHLNVLAWSAEEDRTATMSRISASLSAMGVKASYNRFNTPILYYAGIPGAETELGKENFMLMELRSSIAMAPMETFEKGVPGGIFKVCDRIRMRPVCIDTQLAAQRAGLIGNYNVFVLGGSGTGKSFFTNSYARALYNAGQYVFIVDVGGSYRGQTELVHEESGGADGQYLDWDAEHPLSFNPFQGWETWFSADGRIKQEESGVNSLLSILETIWTPVTGWTSSALTILRQTVADFLFSLRREARAGSARLPVFNDYYLFLSKSVRPRIVKGTYACGEEKNIGTDRIDIGDFILALKAYSSSGEFGFLFNDEHPRDLFGSRWVAIDLLNASDIKDKKFYSLVVLSIMNAFDNKMRSASGFKNLIVDEAWKAIANETMAPYLAGLWKTARKYNCSAMVVTQELADILSSPAIKTAILDNSDVKVLLDQSNHLNTFAKLQETLALSKKDKNLVLSINRALNPAYHYREVFITIGGKYSSVFATEVSPQEAMAFESNHEKKRPMLERAAELGSIRAAIDDLTHRKKKPQDDN